MEAKDLLLLVDGQYNQLLISLSRDPTYKTIRQVYDCPVVNQNGSTMIDVEIIQFQTRGTAKTHAIVQIQPVNPIVLDLLSKYFQTSEVKESQRSESRILFMFSQQPEPSKKKFDSVAINGNLLF